MLRISIKLLVKLYEEDKLSLRQIASQFGHTHGYISKKLKELGISIRSGYSKEYYTNRHKNKGKKSKSKEGYILQHGNREHRLVMEQHLGRKLSKEEQVHHIDFNKSNNDLSNLFLFPDMRSHQLFHGYIKQNIITPDEFMATIYPKYLDTLLNYGWILARYIEDKISANKLAREIGVSRTILTNELKRTGIWDLRPPSIQ
jgi:IS30 family transposase